ncbi:MAG: methyltransferase domain-containing protein, partial [Pirellulales bacterium]
MRDNVRAFVEIAATAWELAGPVYEFGAYCVEGQADIANLRRLFPGSLYVGCDMRPGPGVDRVEDLAQLSLPDGCARTIICVDTLEHVFEARRAVDEMIRVLAPGGTLLVAAPMNFRVHDYPSDYWRLTPSCLSRLLAPLDAAVIGWQGVESHPHTVFGAACKGPVRGGFSRGAGRFMDGFQAWLTAQRAAIRWPTRAKNAVAGVIRG